VTTRQYSKTALSYVKRLYGVQLFFESNFEFIGRHFSSSLLLFATCLVSRCYS
jgi:hypothetical protein